jgi:hypothetical protein
MTRETRTYLDKMEDEKDEKYKERHMRKQDPLEEMMRFQTDRGLNLQEYDAMNEATSIFEEILESLGFDVPKENRKRLRGHISTFIESLNMLNIAMPAIDGKPTGSDRVDPHADMIELNIGAIMKLGHNVPESLLEMAREINGRKGEIVNGKFEKYKPNHPKYEEPYKANYNNTKL